jgi:hypothetical protein
MGEALLAVQIPDLLDDAVVGSAARVEDGANLAVDVTPGATDLIAKVVIELTAQLQPQDSYTGLRVHRCPPGELVECIEFEASLFLPHAADVAVLSDIVADGSMTLAGDTGEVRAHERGSGQRGFAGRMSRERAMRQDGHPRGGMVRRALAEGGAE